MDINKILLFTISFFYYPQITLLESVKYLRISLWKKRPQQFSSILKNSIILHYEKKSRQFTVYWLEKVYTFKIVFLYTNVG